MGNAIQISLIGKPGCHLCDDARGALADTIATFSGSYPDVEVAVSEFDILEDSALAEKYADEIPVVLVNGKMNSYWHVDKARLLAKLAEVADA